MQSPQASQSNNAPISILTVSTLFPNEAQPSHGIFVESRLRKLVADGRVRAQVLAPVPWMPPFVKYGALTPLRKVAACTQRHGVAVAHPRYIVIPKVGMNIAPFSLYLSMRASLRQLMAAGAKIDLIDAHYFYPDGVAAVWLARDFNLPVVVTARGSDINLIPQYRFPRALILKAAKNAQAVITVCQALKDRLIEMGVDEQEITVLRNGVDLELFRPRDRKVLRQKFGLSTFTLASVGHLIERKGHHHVISALTELPDATLLIVGDGPQRSALETMADKLGVSHRVRFLGVLDQPELCDVYNCADATVLASSREGWANVLLESMACGTPVVASAVWGTPEVVARPEAGRLMPSLDANGVIAALTELRLAQPDRAGTRKYAESFDWQSTTEGQIALFRKILSSPKWSQTRTPI